MKIDRMIALIMLLLERRRISIAELARICGVTTRTIQRDLEAIGQAGVPIVSFPGVGGGVGIAEDYKRAKRLFSTADVATLLMSLGSIRSSLSGDELVSALAKIKGMLPADQHEALELKAGQITIDPTPWVGGRNCDEVIVLLQAAMDERRPVRFNYNDRLQQKTVRTVEPYRLIFKRMRWYFEGFCRERQDFRIFKLSRMSAVSLLKEHFQPLDYTPQTIIEPVFTDQNLVAATLRVQEPILDQIIDFCGPESVQPETDASWIAILPVLDNVIGYKFLLGFGADCECLAPANLRANFACYLRQITTLYPELAEKSGT